MRDRRDTKEEAKSVRERFGQRWIFGGIATAADYYRAAGSEDWEYTYDNLDSETQALFTREEWSQKNQWLADYNSAVYHLLSVDLEDASGKPVAEVVLRLTGEDGSYSIRYTQFVLEDGVWKHRFTQEEELFMPGKPFEEWVEAR